MNSADRPLDAVPLVARVCGAVVVLLGLATLVGWVADLPGLTTLAVDAIPMAPSTALLFVVTGGLLVALRPGWHSGKAPSTAVILAGSVTLAAVILLVLSVAGVQPAWEHLGLSISGVVAGAPLGHMSPVTALGFVLAGTGLAGLTVRGGPRAAKVALALAVVLVFLSTILLFAYAASQPFLYDTGVIPPALGTSIGHAILGVGLLTISSAEIWASSDAAVRWSSITQMVTALIIAAGVILTPAFLLFQGYQERFRSGVEEQLLTVAELKVGQIQQWRAERIIDARVFFGEPLGELAERSMYGGDELARESIRRWFRPIVSAFGYPRMSLHDTLGVARLTVPDAAEGGARAPHPAADVRRVIADGEVVLESFHRDEPAGPLHMTVVAPVRVDGAAIGALVIRVDPATYLFPLIREWPVPSRTAETLLVARDGEDVVFLNQLRFQEDAALNLRLPLSGTGLPAARAILGEVGIVEGTDYRGQAVVAAVLPVPDSDWFLVARMDTAEVYAPLNAGLRWTLALVAVLLASAVVGLSVIWQRKEKLFYQSLAAAERRQGTILSSIGDAVIATDAEGRVEFMNPVAEDLTGRVAEEAEGRPLKSVFRIVREDTREAAPSPVDRVMWERRVVETAENLVLVARDGSERPVASSGAPVLAEDGSLTGVVLTFRDQTQEREAREALVKAVERAERYLEVAGVMIVVLDGHGRVEVINPRGAELLGYGVDEIVGLDWIDNFVPDADPPPDQDIRDRAGVADPGTAGTVETEIVTRDGEIRVCRWKSVVERDAEGAVVRTILSGEDITEPRRAERQLRESEERYRNLFDSIRDAIVIADPDRTIIGCNAAFTDLFGYGEDEIVGERTDVVYESVEEFRQMGERLRKNRGDPNFIQSVRFVKKSGTVFVGETNAFPLMNGAGEIEGWVGLIRDITERLAAETRLAESEARYRSLYESAPVGIFRTAIDGEVLQVNATLAAILGFDSPAEVLGHHAHLPGDLYVRPERRDELIREIREYGEVENFEYEARRQDGDTVWLAMSARVVEREQSGDVVMDGFVMDVTERRRAEAERESLQTQLMQAQKMESVGRLAGGIAHDFNNMLAVIVGQGSMLLADLPDGTPGHEDVATMLEAAERSSDLVRHLLTFAREQTVQPRLLVLDETVQSMLKMLRRTIDENIRLEWHPGGADWIVRMDPVQIDQMLVNLLINARDAIDSVGRVEIRTGTTRIDEEYTLEHPDAHPGEFVVLEVTDSGSGMSEETLARVFEPFFTTKERGQGTGLGLSTVYGIVHQNGGFINACSEPGHGSTFRIYLPRVHERPSGEPASVPVVTSTTGETILVVEDEPAVLKSTVKALHRLGYATLSASLPTDAVEVMRDRGHEVDLVLTDIIMPEMTGRDLASLIGETFPDVPVLYMSGYPADAITHHGELATGVNFIQKPFTFANLGEKVREVLCG